MATRRDMLIKWIRRSITMTNIVSHTDHMIFVTCRMLLEEQELPTPHAYINSHQTCSGVVVTQSLVLCAVLCRLLYFLPLWSLYCHHACLRDIQYSRIQF